MKIQGKRMTISKTSTTPKVKYEFGGPMVLVGIIGIALFILFIFTELPKRILRKIGEFIARLLE